MASFEQEEAEFYLVLGRAITQWAHVEDALFRVFAAAMSAASEDRAAAAFYSQIAFRAKLDMTDAVLAIVLKEPHIDDWARLFSRLKKRSGKRNALAHHEAVLVAEKQRGSPISKLTPKLKPRVNKPSNRMAYIFGTEDLGTKDILSIDRDFNIIRGDLERFLKSALLQKRQ